MKKFFFAALIGASMVACNDTKTEGGVDTTSQTYKDSVANANAMSTPDTSSSMMSTPDTSSAMKDTSSMMSSDTSKMK